MERLTLAAPSVSADVSEFFCAELEAFVATSNRERPGAWARVEALQQACRREAPATAAALGRSERVLAEETGA
jgi:hypothetical protein